MKPARKAQRRRADALFSRRIRGRGVCEAQGFRFPCSGHLQCAHIVPRRYLAVRWDEANALCLCAAHHVFFTHHPVEFRRYVEEMFPGRLEVMEEKATTDHPKPDYEAILAGFGEPA